MYISKIFKYYWPHVKKYPKTGIATFLLSGIAVLLMHLLEPIIYKNIIDLVSEGLAGDAVGRELMFLIFVLAIIIVAYNILLRFSDWSIVYSQSNILKDIANDTYRRLLSHSYEFFTNRFAGALVTKVKRFVRSFETIHDQVIFSFWMDGIKLLSIIIALAIFAPPLLIIFFIWFAVYIFVLYFMIREQFSRDIKRATAESKTTGVLADAITNVLNIKMFAALRSERKRFDDVTGKEKKRRDSSWYYHNWQNLFQGFYIGLFHVLITYFAIKMWLAGSISAGVIILVQLYVYKAFDIVWNMGRNVRRVMEAFADATEMVEIFEQKTDVQDIKGAEKCTINKGEIEVKNITFAYEKGNNVFENFSLKVLPGERIGLVGHSGSGKTTITKLLLRFADIQSGQILIDGQDIARIKQDDLRRNISYVPQEPMLFHRSLAENIAYANQDASMEEIINVAKSAYAHEFISKLPDGYDTLVGERGVKLSGGERQRVAIARAMLKDTPIIILDEATSALDSVSEHYIQDALNNLMQGCTVLVVAHRLSTIQRMDKIVVFEDGEIKEQGTHEELLSGDGVYHNFWQQQVSGMLLD